jgi:hypothetical protein
MTFPFLSTKMNPRELADHIRSGPAKLVHDKPVRFRCYPHQELGITEHEWVLFVKALGNIKGIQQLIFVCKPGSRDFYPFQAIAEAVNNAQSLTYLKVVSSPETRNRDHSGLVMLGNAIRQHSSLVDFSWFNMCSLEEESLKTTLDPVLLALPACPHLRKITFSSKQATSDAVRNLLELPKDTNLALAVEMDVWLAVADEIRLGHCRVETLNLWMFRGSSPEATEAVKALANAIREDHNLVRLGLCIDSGFTDEAGAALAEALTVNKTLSKVSLAVSMRPSFRVRHKANLGVHAYEAFGAMLRANTNLCLSVPPLCTTSSGDERLLKSHKQMRIEQRLNTVGRGTLLSSSNTPREAWVNALQELNSKNIDDPLKVSCLYSLLRLSPAAFIF